MEYKIDGTFSANTLVELEKFVSYCFDYHPDTMPSYDWGELVAAINTTHVKIMVAIAPLATKD